MRSFNILWFNAPICIERPYCSVKHRRSSVLIRFRDQLQRAYFHQQFYSWVLSCDKTKTRYYIVIIFSFTGLFGVLVVMYNNNFECIFGVMSLLISIILIIKRLIIFLWMATKLIKPWLTFVIVTISLCKIRSILKMREYFYKGFVWIMREDTR